MGSMKAKACESSISAIERAIGYFGSQQALAEAMGVYQSYVSKLKRGDGMVPAERCRQIEELTNGAVTRAELRPDIFGDMAA